MYETVKTITEKIQDIRVEEEPFNGFISAHSSTDYNNQKRHYNFEVKIGSEKDKVLLKMLEQ